MFALRDVYFASDNLNVISSQNSLSSCIYLNDSQTSYQQQSRSLRALPSDKQQKLIGKRNGERPFEALEDD